MQENNSYDDDSDLPYGTEDESDLEVVLKSAIASVNVTGTDWTTETILSQLKKGNIELNPRFQRRDAWEKKRKSLFIESLLLGLPVPQIVLAERQDQRGKYIVLDGKQRLLCLSQFASLNESDGYTPFKLSGLEIRPDLDGKSYHDLIDDFQLRELATALDNQTIRTVVVRNWKSEALLFHVFLRLNRGSKPLSPQELRQALHPGPFMDFADEESATSIPIQDMLRLSKPDFRMRDVELAIRYLSYKHRITEYRGNLKQFLDDSCEFFNTHWSDWSHRLSDDMRLLEEIHALIRISFKTGFNYSKWIGNRYETRFNRAVFDVFVFALTSPHVRRAIQNDPSRLDEAFRSLCESDSSFIEAIERTTKSVSATRYRIEAFCNKVSNAYQITIKPPIIGI